MPSWPNFSCGQTVEGLKLLDLICWISESMDVLARTREPDGMPVIVMPPVQRSAVWRPTEVVDLWDSVMRGLPIGVFYLVDANDDGRKGVLNGKTTPVPYAGFDLLDGQQRVRALLLGIRNYSEEKRRSSGSILAQTGHNSGRFFALPQRLSLSATTA